MIKEEHIVLERSAILNLDPDRGDKGDGGDGGDGSDLDDEEGGKEKKEEKKENKENKEKKLLLAHGWAGQPKVVQEVLAHQKTFYET